MSVKFTTAAVFVWLVLAAPVGAAVLSAPDLLRAVRLNEVEKVRQHLEDGGGADLYDRSGRTALQVAIRYGHASLTALLVKSGAGLGTADKDGWLAMHHAAANGDLVAVEVLISAGAQVDAMDPYRYRPLHLAAREGHEEICLLLLRHGADPRARIDVGFTAADLAQDQIPSLAELLKQKDAL